MAHGIERCGLDHLLEQRVLLEATAFDQDDIDPEPCGLQGQRDPSRPRTNDGQCASAH